MIKVRILIGLGLVALFGSWTRPVAAVIVYGSGDPENNRTAPTGALADSGWQYQGFWSGFLGTPIAPNYFITAYHVGGTLGTQMGLNGNGYTSVGWVRDPYTNSDLRIYKVSETFSSWAPLYTGSDEAGKALVVIGGGGQRGAELSIGGVTKGWLWDNNGHNQRWGQNNVNGFASIAVAGDNRLLYATFDEPGTGDNKAGFPNPNNPNEAHLTNGDSGGGVFIQEGGVWKLAGINYAADNPFNTTNSDAGAFNAALFDKGGYWQKVGTQPWAFNTDTASNKPTGFYASRISTEVSWINSIITYWKNDANGNWNTTTNWSSGVVPNGTDKVANFTSPITAPRTITLNAPMTVGTVDFNNASSYTITGGSTLSLDASAGTYVRMDVYLGNHVVSTPISIVDDTLAFDLYPGTSLTLSGALTNASGRPLKMEHTIAGVVGGGTLTIAGPQSHGIGSRIDVNTGTLNLNSDGGVNLTINANSTTNFGATQHLAAVSVGPGATATETLGGGKTLVTSVLSIDPTGRLDLTNNALVVQSDAVNRAAVLASVTSNLATGYNGAAWNGPGINSAAAAADSNHVTSLGVMLNSDATGNAIYGAFGGQSVGPNSILVKYTYAGDANLSGFIDGSDYALLDNGFNQGLAGWFNGDFNYDGTINGVDYAIIDQAFNNQGGILSADMVAARVAQFGDEYSSELFSMQSVPEPGSIVLMALALAGLMFRAARCRNLRRS